MKRLIPLICSVAVIIGFIIGVILFLRGGINENELKFGEVEVGEIRSAITTNGKIIPAFEESIISPVNTRILEVYVQEGDSVSIGAPLLRLDIEEFHNQYQQLADQLSIKQSEITSQSITDETQIADMEMRIKTKELAVDQLKEEYESEKRLDSIGSGTGERVRKARLAWQTSSLELKQMRIQLRNERRINRSRAESKQLEGKISSRELQKALRTLDEARILAPRAGIVTYLISNIGAAISTGEVLAILSDMTNFKVAGELPEGNGDKISVGAPVEVRLGKKTFTGKISNVSAKSTSGMIPFVVRLDSMDAAGLRGGVNVRISVIYDIKSDVLRIPMGTFFKGGGEYDIYVQTSPTTLEKRKVRLGDSNLDYIEVVSGLSKGDRVNLNLLETTKNKQRIIKNK
ncbi:MAG: HlyD family efflux transporter periplasmic adaptor subunit [Muribaculaceae bacterium]|nr:HlyD family efflux transporter periplasmic adaptor subunit [Muribaculaceae bacterium]